jgi:hypothetical protein
MAVKHSYTSPVTDQNNTDEVGPTDWNADHTIEDTTITEAKLSISDNTTKDVSASAHGFVPKAPNDTTKFLRGDGSWASPFVSGYTPPTVVGAVTADGASPHSWTVPAGTTNGDLMIVAGMYTNSTPNVNGPDNDSSWTELWRADTSSTEYQVVYYKIASSQGSTVTLTHSAGSDAAGVLVVYRGYDTLETSSAVMDSFQTPNVVAPAAAMQVLIWMMTTGSTTLNDAHGLSNDAYVYGTGTNHSRVLVCHLGTIWDGVTFQYMLDQNSGPPGSYGLAFTAVFS